MTAVLQTARMGVLHARMRALPFADIDGLAPGASLILAPHPDDESLGCGGMIAELCDRGRPPVVVCVTDGAASHPGSRAYPPPRLAEVRRAEMRAACAALGLEESRIVFLDLPDAASPLQGPMFDQAAHRIASLLTAHTVRTIFATWPHDPHCDHLATARLAQHAASASCVRLMYYPVWGWLVRGEEPAPTRTVSGVRLDVGRRLSRKRRAISAHASQYAGLITDSPDGFQLPPALLAVFDAPYEVFLDP